MRYSAGNQAALPSVVVDDGSLVAGILGVPHFLLEAARAPDDQRDPHMPRLPFHGGDVPQGGAGIDGVRHV